MDSYQVCFVSDWLSCCCRLEAVQQQLAGMQGFVAKAEAWRKRWEACQMEVEDLQAANARAITRRQELVNSYWPVMERLGAAEDVVAALTKQVRGRGMAGGRGWK
jgi:hypothetical protein